MQIQLKQREIEAALRGYINKQGISLVGRKLEIAFTSGRSGNGLTADISIEEMEIPGFGAGDPEEDTSVGMGSEDASAEPQDAPKASKTGTKPVLKAVGPADGYAEGQSPISAPTPAAAITAVVAPPVFNSEPAVAQIGDPVQSNPEVSEPVKAGVSLFN